MDITVCSFCYRRQRCSVGCSVKGGGGSKSFYRKDFSLEEEVPFYLTICCLEACINFNIHMVSFQLDEGIKLQTWDNRNFLYFFMERHIYYDFNKFIRGDIIGNVG